MGMKCLRAFLSLIPLELNDSPRSGSNWLSDMDWLTYHHTKRAVLQFLSRPRPLEGEVHSWLDASYSIHISALTPRFEISASACQWSGLILCRRKLSLWLFLSSSWSEYCKPGCLLLEWMWRIKLTSILILLLFEVDDTVRESRGISFEM